MVEEYFEIWPSGMPQIDSILPLSDIRYTSPWLKKILKFGLLKYPRLTLFYYSLSYHGWRSITFWNVPDGLSFSIFHTENIWNLPKLTWNRPELTWNRPELTWNRPDLTWSRQIITWNHTVALLQMKSRRYQDITRFWSISGNF